MKTSNKLILAFILVSFLSSIVLYFALNSEYHKGHFVTQVQLHKEIYIKQPVAEPRVLSFDGTIWVNIIPADSFSLELPRINRDADAGMFELGPTVRLKGEHSPGAALYYRQSGDTLFVTGNITTTLHRPFSGWPYRNSVPQVNIYGSPRGGIFLHNGQLYLQGTSDPALRRSVRLDISNSTLWVGMQYEHRRGPTEYFDSLDIHSDMSVTILNTAADIRYLHINLQDSSAVSDQYAHINQSLTQSSPDSRVDLSGQTLKNNQLIIH